MATVLRDAQGLANRLVIRLCARLAEQDRLSEIIFGTAMAFTCLGAGFCVLQQLEKLHPHIFSDQNVSFELIMPMAEKRKPAPPPAIISSSHLVAPQRLRPSKAPLTDANRSLKNVPVVPTALTANRNINQSLPSSSPAVTTGSPDAAIAAPLPVSDMTAGSPGGRSTAPTSTSQDNKTRNSGDNSAASTAPLKPEGDLNAVAGADFGAQRTLALMDSSSPRMGNIKPYKRDLLQRLSRSWHPRKGFESITLSLTIAKDGTLINDEVVESSGLAKADREALDAVESTQFSPLPDWYTGDHLTWKLDLSGALPSNRQ